MKTVTISGVPYASDALHFLTPEQIIELALNITTMTLNYFAAKKIHPEAHSYCFRTMFAYIMRLMDPDNVEFSFAEIDAALAKEENSDGEENLIDNAPALYYSIQVGRRIDTSVDVSENTLRTVSAVAGPSGLNKGKGKATDLDNYNSRQKYYYPGNRAPAPTSAKKRTCDDSEDSSRRVRPRISNDAPAPRFMPTKSKKVGPSQLPRPRPQDLERKPAFYRRSHAGVPEFGNWHPNAATSTPSHESQDVSSTVARAFEAATAAARAAGSVCPTFNPTDIFTSPATSTSAASTSTRPSPTAATITAADIVSPSSSPVYIPPIASTPIIAPRRTAATLTAADVISPPSSPVPAPVISTSPTSITPPTAPLRPSPSSCEKPLVFDHDHSPDSHYENPIVLDSDDEGDIQNARSSADSLNRRAPASTTGQEAVFSTPAPVRVADADDASILALDNQLGIIWTHPVDVMPSPSAPSLSVKAENTDVSSISLASSNEAQRSGNANISLSKPGRSTKLTSKKRARNDQDDIDGPARRTRSRVSDYITFPEGRNVIERNGIKYHFVAGPSCTTFPSVNSKNGQPIPPFNHFAKLPRRRPQGLRREYGFYHGSHFENAWVPEFGQYDRPPMTIEETLPPWHPNAAASSTSALASSRSADISNNSVPAIDSSFISAVPSASSSPSRQCLRDFEDDNDDNA
ncbi:hypothetical protein H0H87_007027 [Tephrocybe sp. NHM501043]|nr:hypothetical protein H0H87_007027 [Tephrocybe sp. NHM501043]